MQQRATFICTFVAIAATVAHATVATASSSAGGGRRTVSLLREPGPSSAALYFSPVKHTGALDGPVNASSASNADGSEDEAKAAWYVAQWNNPSPFDARNLPPHGDAPIPDACNATSSSGLFGGLTPEWGVANAHARVCSLRGDASPPRHYVQLAASGGDALECGKEFDMFLSPLGAAYPRYRPANMDPGADQWSLNTTAGGERVTKIVLGVDIASDFVEVQARCGTDAHHECGSPLDYGYITIGLPIHNNVSREQNFFQVQVYDSRQGVCPGVDPCTTDGSIGWYFRTLPVLGSNVAIGSFGGGATCLTPGAAQRYELDVLPVLQRVVAEGARLYGADANLDHWHVNGLYVGQGLQGAAAMTTTVGNIKLEATLEG